MFGPKLEHLVSGNQLHPERLLPVTKSSALSFTGVYFMMSMIDPKGSRPKVHGKSHSLTIDEQRKMLAAEYDTTVWPARPLDVRMTEDSHDRADG
jgi:hypothetical protein